MANVQAIATLHRSGHSRRHIARILGINRETVAKYVTQFQNQPNPQTGSETPQGITSLSRAASGPANSCEPYRELILQWLEAGLSAKRIHQDLVDQQGYSGSYHCVWRFVSRLQRKMPVPFRRLETEPGEELQIDFGTAAPVIDRDGKIRRPWMLRLVLSHSRKAYSQVVYRQTTDNFLAVIENAFEYFGGVPRRLLIDNLRAAVARADWYDPELHPKLQSFASHYGTAFVPTKPYTPRHKGKVENSVKYVKNNALKGRTFSSLEEQNRFLLEWEQNVADRRIHGTVKEQVEKRFLEHEKTALLPLPQERFANFKEARRSVNRDGHLEVDKAYYSAPPEYVGRRMWVRWDNRLVRIFDERFKLVATHSICEPGRFRTANQHIPKEKVSAVERGTVALLRQTAAIGPHTKAWAEAMIHARGVEGVRVLVGLKAIAGKHRSEQIEEACRVALLHGAYRLRTIRTLIKKGTQTEQLSMSFIEDHPIIRPLSDYSLSSLNKFWKESNNECPSS
jgi:transposase